MPWIETDPSRRGQVLKAFLADDGSIAQMPSKEWKRKVLLDHVAGAFEIGVVYSEYEVNRVVTQFHPDYAMLRRYLVDYGFLTREDGQYWRTGGSVELDDLV